MSRTLSEEQLIRKFFLGDLPESEEDRIQERAFTDPDFYEALLMVEGELVDGYALGLISAEERKKLERGFLMNPHQYQKVRIVRTLEQYISDTKASVIPTQETDRRSLFSRLGSRLKKSKPPATDLNSREKSRANARDVWERPLKEAHANRELILSLIADEWLGLRILLLLKSNPLATTAYIFSHLDGDRVKSEEALWRLIECGLVERLEERYSCSWFGSQMLATVEKLSNSPVDLNSQSIS
jgi:hypothetical protein